MSESGSTEIEPAREEPARESAGARLTAERRSLGLSLGDIARQLKLSVRQVEALERDDYASFAGPVFVRGFLRNYAKLLGLDPEALIAAASPAPAASAAPAPVEEERDTAANPERSRRIFTSVVIVALVVIAVVLLASNAARDRRVDAPGNDVPALQPSVAGTVAQSEPPPSTNAVPASPPEAAPEKPVSPQAGELSAATPAPPSKAPETSTTQQASNASQASSPTATAPSSAPSDAAEPAVKPRLLVSGTGPAQVRMVFEGESWVEVKDANGATIFSRLNAAGTERLIRGQAPLSLVVGNASNVKVLFHDKPVDLQPHTRVDVARITLE
jgi:cytoskeleton protein RodZ